MLPPVAGPSRPGNGGGGVNANLGYLPDAQVARVLQDMFDRGLDPFGDIRSQVVGAKRQRDDTDADDGYEQQSGKGKGRGPGNGPGFGAPRGAAVAAISLFPLRHHAAVGGADR